MRVIFARQPLPEPTSAHFLDNSIFLVGPTLRDEGRKAGLISWRIEALDILKELGFGGTVLVPEDEGWICPKDMEYGDQVHWEHNALRMATCVCC